MTPVTKLCPFQGSHKRALVVRDLEGSGREKTGVKALEEHLHEKLILSGWQAEHSAAIVLDPELESWLRFGTAHMGRILTERARKNRNQCQQWETKLQAACERLGGMDEHGKPLRPKEVFHDLLKLYGIPPSNAVLGRLAEKESLHGCKVSSFCRFYELMQKWFPIA